MGRTPYEDTGRILIREKLFDSEKYKLPAQYYALIEIGGAYAYKFIPFADFLGLPYIPKECND